MILFSFQIFALSGKFIDTIIIKGKLIKIIDAQLILKKMDIDFLHYTAKPLNWTHL